MPITARAGRWRSGAIVLVGAWLLLSPWVLGFAAANGPLASNAVIEGAVIAGLTIPGLAGTQRRQRRSGLIVLAGGLWLCVAAVLYRQGTGPAFWSTIAAGVLTAFLAAVSATRRRAKK